MLSSLPSIRFLVGFQPDPENVVITHMPFAAKDKVKKGIARMMVLAMPLSFRDNEISRRILFITI